MDKKPENIGKYKVISTLGRGGMGLVYKAHDADIERFVAIKTLREVVLKDSPDSLEKFKVEAKSAGKLSHSNIITIYDSGKSQEGVPYIVMEYVEGKTLDDLIKERAPFELSQVLKYLEPLADAIDYAHDHNVYHRDIKPSNIIIDSGGRPLLMDFGVSEIKEMALFPSGDISGTPSYMSPEHLKGKDRDGATDNFALAVIAYEMFTGLKPFPGDDFMTIISKINNAEPVSFADYFIETNHAVENVIKKALSKNVEDRYPTSKAFVNALRDQSSKQISYKNQAESHDGSGSQIMDFDHQPDVDQIKGELFTMPQQPVSMLQMSEMVEDDIDDGVLEQKSLTEEAVDSNFASSDVVVDNEDATISNIERAADGINGKADISLEESSMQPDDTDKTKTNFEVPKSKSQGKTSQLKRAMFFLISIAFIGIMAFILILNQEGFKSTQKSSNGDMAMASSSDSILSKGQEVVDEVQEKKDKKIVEPSKENATKTLIKPDSVKTIYTRKTYNQKDDQNINEETEDDLTKDYYLAAFKARQSGRDSEYKKMINKFLSGGYKIKVAPMMSIARGESFSSKIEKKAHKEILEEIGELLLTDSDWSVRSASIAALGRLDVVKYKSEIIKLASEDPRPEVRRIARSTISKWRDPFDG